MANGCIREKQPGCPMQAVIPSVTVESIEGIKNLADCLVHVSDINTTFYIDDKHRPIITWAGPIDIPGYDMEGNPNNYRDQIVTDVANQIAVIYDKSGNGYLFGLAENIDLQEQVNNKLDQMAEDGTLEQIVSTYLGVITPKAFGAVSGNNEDQSQAIADCINYAFDNGIKTVLLDGDYYVAQKMEFTSKSDITIKNGTLRVHEVDENLTAGFKPLSFIDCHNINIENISVKEVEPVTRARNLYQGGIYFNNCHECKVSKCYIENLHNGIVLQNHCYNCTIENNTVKVNEHSSQFAQSAILNYASHDNVIKNNNIVGEFYDGTLSVYGAGCNNVVVDGNIITGVFDDTITWLSEGITIDAGCDSTIVTNNIVSGQTYGIDNKNDSVNTLIANNTVYSCKAAICDRPGEESKQTFNCQIKNNQIIFRKAWDTSTVSTFLFSGTYYFVGIYIYGRLSCDVNSNKITIYKGIDAQTVCGIYASASATSTSNQYQSQFDIKNNTIEFATGFGNSVGNAGTESAGIHIKDVRKGTIIGNSLKVDLSTSNYYFITCESSNYYLLITDNNFLATSTDHHKFINMLEDSTISESEVVRNKIKGGYPLIRLNDVTNIVEMPKFNIVGHQIKTLDFTANTWTAVCTLKATYAGGFYRIKLQGIKSASGNKYLFAEYVVAIGASSVTPTELVKYNSGLDVRLVHNTGSNTCDIEVKATTSLTNFSELFITEIMGDQRLTLINPTA